MRVTMLLRCLAMMRGGGETQHLGWVHELTALGVDVEIITGRPLFGAARYPVEGARATVLRSPYMRDLVYRVGRRRGFGRTMMMALHADEEWFCRAAWSHIARSARRPDIVHAHELHRIARLRRLDIPVVINLTGPPHPRYTEDLRLADAITAEGWAAAHLPGILGRSVESVPKGVDTTLFRPDGAGDKRNELGLAGKRVVVAVSRLVPIKNVGLLIEAMPHLLRDRPDAHLLVVGEGPQRETLLRRVGELELGAAVTFAGYVPQADTPAYYRAGDVFGLSSEFDNSPNVLLEAMACGLPVVSTDVGGVREFVDAEAGSELVPAGDARALAAALSRALANPDAARLAGAHNRRFVVEHFSLRRSASRLLDVYRRVIEARRHPARASA